MLFDLIVIGSGPAGQRAALQGAKAGKKVVIVEDYPIVGGGCLHSGTIPSKSFRESVYRWSLSSRGTLAQEGENVVRRGFRKTELPEMPRLVRRRDRVVSGEAQVIFDQLKRNGVKVLNGKARLVSSNDVEVSSRKGIDKLTGSFIIIATGARPVAAAHLAIDGKTVHDSNTILSLKKTPKTLVVLGAGIIGCEYASMFATAGTKVFLVDRRHEILASVDREIVDHLVDRYSQQGVEVLLEVEAKKIDRPSPRSLRSGSVVHLSNGRQIKTDVVLVAQGRYGNTEALGLSGVGIQCDERGLVKVDEHFRTHIPNVYAVGDVIGAPALASTSMEQGRIACGHAFKIEDPRSSHKMPKIFPYGIYTIPEISMVGRTEEDLSQDKSVDLIVGRARYRELARSQIVGDKWGLLKLMVDRKTHKILGVHIVGDSAADLIHIGQAVMALEGDVYYFINSVFNYPTLAEAYKVAAFNAVNQMKGVATPEDE